MTKKRGRPSKFTAETRQVLLTALAGGALVKDACAMAGIGESTYKEWLALGEAHLAGKKHPRMPHRIAERQEFAAFAAALKKAR